MDNISNDQEIKIKATKSIKWSALMEIVSRTASPIIFVVLARLLSPADFGVVSIAIVVITFAQMFWDAGLSKALIQTEEAPERAANVVFWSNAFLGIIIYLMLFIFAPWIVTFFNSPGSSAVLRALGIQIFISSLTSVQQALFVRELNFRKLFWIRLITAFFPGFFSIPLASFGYGVWSLVVGTIAGQLLNLLLIWHFSSWRPKIEYDIHLFKKMFSFGVWVLAESFGAWLLMWGDSFIVGKFLGMHDLGVYRTGIMMVSIIFGFVLNPFLPVLYPTFSRLQHNKAALKQNFHKINKVVFSLTWPIGVGLLLIGPRVETVFLGTKWQGVGLVLSILGFKEAIAWLAGINPEAYRAMGRPDINSKLMFVQILYFLPAYLFAAQSGLKTFVYVRFCVAFLATPIHVYLCRKILGVSAFYLWHDGKNFFLASLLMGLIIGCTKLILHSIAPAFPPFLALFGIIAIGVVSYIVFLWFFEREFISHTMHLVRRAV